MSFFGAQAVRLLRESWGGKVKVSPDGTVDPQGATLLSEELFSMLAGSEPMATTSPVMISQNPAPGSDPVPPLTINTAPGTGGSFNNGIVLNGDLLIPAGMGGGINVPQVTTAGQTVNGSINVLGGFYLWNGVPLGLGGGGGTTTFLGRVVSGTGNTYLVNLFGNGSGQPATNPLQGQPVKLPGDPSNPPVTVTVPQLDSSEQIPAGTWIAPIFEFTNTILINGQNTRVITYEYQPPIWL